MISKSELQSYLQCRRKLWLERHRQDLVPSDDPSTYRRIADGNLVGEMSRRQLGSDFIWPRGGDGRELAADAAKELLSQSPQKSAAEVPMLHAGVYARADALVPEGGGYVLRETKASSFPLRSDHETPGTPKEHHINDLAIQAWVMSESGLPVRRAELNLLDSRWRYPGDNNYSGLFRQLDVTSEVSGRKGEVPAWVASASRTLDGAMPDVQTGKHCNDPYDCPFHGFCKPLDPAAPDSPIELLPDSAGKALARKLRETKGYSSILEPRPDELVGKQSSLYRRIQEAHRTGQEVWVDGTSRIMNQFGYPRYYLDFEGIDLPVPIWAGVRPYEQIPFQWSCHIERRLGVFEHKEFLDLTGSDPSQNCIQKMRAAIDPTDRGPIFVYYAPYERGRLEELAKRHPEHENLLRTYMERLVDLLPLVKEHYYHPKMQGSFSIKRVLPIVAPDLDYGLLDEVQEGTGAQVAYMQAVISTDTAPERKAELDQKLRAYCRQDTWAMIEVAYFLARATRPPRPPGM